MKLIDKDALVAEIERIKKEECPIDTYEGRNKLFYFERFLSFLDTLEVKEVDLQEEPQVKESAKTQHKKNTCKENGDSLTQKSETIDFEQELYKAFGQIKDFTLGMRIAKRFYEIGRNYQEPVSDDLEQAIDNYLATYFGGEKEKQDWPFLKKMAIHFAEWQKQKDSIPISEDLEEAAIQYAKSKHKGEALQKIVAWDFKAGANWQKEKLLANAVDATVHIDAGGYPYIQQMELYDYEKDIPFAKEGDKYKVILIKED